MHQVISIYNIDFSDTCTLSAVSQKLLLLIETSASIPLSMYVCLQ